MSNLIIITYSFFLFLGFNPAPKSLTLIGNPIVVLTNGKNSGTVGSGEMKIQSALLVMSTDTQNPSEMKDICHVTSFMVTVFSGSQKKDPVAYTNTGYVFDNTTKMLLSTVSKGDRVTFTDVRGRCSGDSADRVMNNLSFTIK
jgi:hypothetical protein